MDEEVINTLDAMNQFLMSEKRDDPGMRVSLAESLQELGPHVNAVGPDAQAAYIAIQKRLVRSTANLIDPRTGERLEG